jgi:cofilin
MQSFTISEDIGQHFNDLRMKRAYRYLIVALSEDGTQAVLQTAGARTAPFSEFKAAMPDNQPRYAIYDLEYKTADGRNESKLVFIMYSPDNCT